jgi:hypothetical protein
LFTLPTLLPDSAESGSTGTGEFTLQQQNVKTKASITLGISTILEYLKLYLQSLKTTKSCKQDGERICFLWRGIFAIKVIPLN